MTVRARPRPALVVVAAALGVVALAACGRDEPVWTCVPIGESSVCGTVDGDELGVMAGRLAPGLELRSSGDGERTIVWTGPTGGAGALIGPTGPTATFSRSPDGKLLVVTSP